MTTGVSPFFANKGYHPNIVVHPERNLTSAQARELAIDLDQLHQELWEHIADAQQRYQKSADMRWAPALDFKIGSQAFVKAKFFCSTWLSKKLSKKNLRPFEVIMQPGTHSFTLWLPDTMKAVHPVFHVSMLEPTTPNTIENCVQPPPPLVLIEGEPEFEISKILNSKIDNKAVHECE